MSENCFSCHREGGQASHTEFILRGSEWPGYIEQNLAVLEELSRVEVDGIPILLAKPTQDGIEHGGGDRFEKDGDEYKALRELIERFDNPVECEANDADIATFFEGVTLLDEVETLRKATLTLSGRLPTSEESERVRDLGIDALDPVLDDVMREDEFNERIVEIWNDLFLTDRYLPNTDALDLLPSATFPNLYWFDGLPEGEYEEQRRYSNYGVAREAVNLVSYVVQKDRPFTEILTADYMVFTPASAKSYGVQLSFDDPSDPWSRQEGKLPGIPHAGVLTSSIWLNRFPTTPTNRNRHRSRMTMLYFLGTDILRVGERPVNSDTIVTFPNPTMNADECTGCHGTIDPIAGAFQNWDVAGAYNPPEGGWFPDMRLPGFNGNDMEPSQYSASLQWLSAEIAKDRRFAFSVVQIMYTGITGQPAFTEPTDQTSPSFAADLHAFKVQQAAFDAIVDKFIASSYNLKTVIKELIKTQYFRAKNTTISDAARLAEIHDIGTAKFLPPERLHRKIEAVTGYPWRNGVEGTNYLLSTNEYKIFYGGIDSDSIIGRIDEPNGLMANIAARMANEMACWTTARDFSKEPADRLLFPFVERGYVPTDENGFAVPAVNDAIQANIQYLYKHVLGEQVSLTSPEVQRAYELFVSVWEDGNSGIEAEEYDTNLPGACRATSDWWTGDPLPEERQVSADPDYTVRAWMAVMTYLLSDYRFLHE